MSHARIAVFDAPLASTRTRTSWTATPWTKTLALWLRRSRDRADLRRLGARDLRDAGLTPYDVAVEARKLPWQD